MNPSIKISLLFLSNPAHPNPKCIENAPSTFTLTQPFLSGVQLVDESHTTLSFKLMPLSLFVANLKLDRSNLARAKIESLASYFRFNILIIYPYQRLQHIVAKNSNHPSPNMSPGFNKGLIILAMIFVIVLKITVHWSIGLKFLSSSRLLFLGIRTRNLLHYKKVSLFRGYYYKHFNGRDR